MFSIHGHHNITTVLSLLSTTSTSHTPTELPPTNSTPTATPTLLLDASTARSVTASALFSTGCKAVVWVVSADGRISSRMEGTPGCPGSLSEWLGERADDGVVIAARPLTRAGVQVVGLAVWEPQSVSLKVTDLLDGHELTALETVFVATNAREVIVPDDVPKFDRLKLEDIAMKCNVAFTSRRKKTFDGGSDVLDTIARLCGAQLRHDALLDGKVCASATAALLDYCELTNNPGIEGKLRVSQLTVASCMQLDNCVMRALNILPFPGDGGKKASLFGLLNRCKSAMGTRLLRRWLSQPLQSTDDINGRLDVVDALVSAPDMLRSVRDDHLGKLSDLQTLCRRFTRDSGKQASMEDVVKLYQVAIRLPVLCAALEECESSVLRSRFAIPLKKLCEELATFEALVEMTIDLDKIANGEFCVAPSVDPALGQLKDLQDGIMADISEEYERVKGELSDTLKLERKENLGYFFRLTRKEERIMRGKSNYLVLETRKDGVRFQTTQLKNQSRKYESAAMEYSELDKDMRDKTLDVAGTYVEVFIDVAASLAELDVLCAFALVSTTSRAGYVRPVMLESGGGLLLRQARHPIVEENLPDDTEYIANDIDLRRDQGDQDADGDEGMGTGDGKANEGEASKQDGAGGSLALVTGPNMGGKSTFIRSAGVLTLMAHVGMYLPAEEASVPITDRIFARVGAADNQHRAVSTFMSEMLETASILRSGTAKSLVIIDELGRGTGTTDGFGLAYAISKHIACEMRCACLFATHFYELTTLENDEDVGLMKGAVRNLHVTAVADGKKNGSGGLTFLYEVKKGVCGQSFGVHVAEMARFPKEVSDGARRKAREMEMDGNSEMHGRLALVGKDEREKGVKIMAEFEQKMKAMPRATEQDITSSVNALKEMRKELAQSGNKYIDTLLGVV